jgi:hypothetical protein
LAWMTLPRTKISASVADLGPEVTLDTTGIPPEIIAKVEAAQRKHIISDRYPYRMKMRRKIYESEKALLQTELLKVQKWVRETGERIVLIFEGRDAAGKGGTIKRFTEHLNPRRRSASAGSGTSSATSTTFRPAGRSCCSTARGTTEPVSSP